MQRIIDLLKQAGCNAELTSAITESLVEYKDSVKKQFESDYLAKVEQAKKVCLEEAEAWKAELARRAQIFFETKTHAIEASIAKQSAIGESAAVGKLKDVKAVLEGIELNANANSNAQFEKAKATIKQLMEERDKAITQANRQTAIAEKVVARNRQLVVENSQLKTGNTKQTPQRTPVVAENKNRQTSRIDGSRAKGTTTTTRATILENQTRRPSEPVQHKQANQNPYSISSIAAQMEDE